MKKIFTFPFVILGIFAFCIIITSSCRKFNYTNRIEKSWVVNSYLKNGTDSTTNFNIMKKNYVIEFDNNNGFSETYLDGGTTSITNRGTWVLTNNSKVLQLNQNGNVRTFDIVKLKLKSMDLKRNDTNEEFYFIPK